LALPEIARMRLVGYELSGWPRSESTITHTVDYFMATFTLPYELRLLAWHNQTLVYNLLFACASGTLKDFGLNPRNLGADIGMTAVLHTHNRRLDYHPHVHVVVPGGGVDRAKKQWKKKKSKYLFNEFALARVFRARFLEALTKAGLSLPRTIPRKLGGRLYLRRNWSLRPEVSLALPLPGRHH
jgi:hypothetical protein